MRQKYYLINEHAMNWWNEALASLPIRDCDDVHFQVVSTFNVEQFNSGDFDPSQLSQQCLLI